MYIANIPTWHLDYLRLVRLSWDPNSTDLVKKKKKKRWIIEQISYTIELKHIIHIRMLEDASQI